MLLHLLILMGAFYSVLDAIPGNQRTNRKKFNYIFQEDGACNVTVTARSGLSTSSVQVFAELSERD